DGKVKVLDFGLAKDMSGANASAIARSHQGMSGAREAQGRQAAAVINASAIARSHQEMHNAPTGTPLSNSPTLLSGTMGGMILGTAAYMAPEQAKGRPADKRSDVWAFGCVLYEMLTGKMAFKGEDVSDTLAAVLRAEPDWTALPAKLSPSIRALLEGS